MFTLFTFDTLQFIFVLNVLQSVFKNFFFINLPHPLEKFYLEKKMIVCAS